MAVLPGLLLSNFNVAKMKNVGDGSFFLNETEVVLEFSKMHM